MQLRLVMTMLPLPRVRTFWGRPLFKRGWPNRIHNGALYFMSFDLAKELAEHTYEQVSGCPSWVGVGVHEGGINRWITVWGQAILLKYCCFILIWTSGTGPHGAHSSPVAVPEGHWHRGSRGA